MIPSKEVKDFHTRDDVDSGQTAHHHTLGYGINQAAPGRRTGDRLNALNDDQLTLFECIPRIGDVILSVRLDETETWKLADGQTLVGDYDELVAVNGSLTLPDLSGDVPVGFAGNYFMRVI